MSYCVEGGIDASCTNADHPEQPDIRQTMQDVLDVSCTVRTPTLSGPAMLMRGRDWTLGWRTGTTSRPASSPTTLPK